MGKGRAVVGIILLTIGTVWLLKALGLVSHIDIDELLRMWPVLLILLGIDMLIPRRLMWLEIVLAILIIAATLFIAVRRSTPNFHHSKKEIIWCPSSSETG